MSPAWFLFSANSDNGENFIGNPVALREGSEAQISFSTEGVTGFQCSLGYVHSPLDTLLLPFPFPY